MCSKKTDTCTMWQVHDRFAGMEYVECWGQFDNGYYFLIRSPLESIKESASISNSFYFIVGIIIIVVSGIVILVMTNRITRPISELTKLSEKMSDLDLMPDIKAGQVMRLMYLAITLTKCPENLRARSQS